MSADESSQLQRFWAIILFVVGGIFVGIVGIMALWQSSHPRVNAQSQVMLKASAARKHVKSFFDAAESGDVRVLSEMLKGNPSLVQVQGADGQSALHEAARTGQTAAVALLLDHGAKIELADKKYSGTPLEWAVYAGRTSTVKLLLDRGAKPTSDMLEIAERGSRGAVHGAADTSRADYSKEVTLLENAGVTPDTGVIFMSHLGNAKLPLEPVAKPIAGKWNPGLQTEMTAGGNLVGSMLDIGSAAHRSSDGVTLYDADEYTGLLSRDAYAAPLEIDAEAMTDGTDLRLYYGLAEVAFNRDYRLTQLHLINPETGQYIRVENEGKIPIKKFVKIRWIFAPHLMRVMVDGEQRYQCKGNFAHIRGRVGIGPAWRSTVTVKSIYVHPISENAKADSVAGGGG